MSIITGLTPPIGAREWRVEPKLPPGVTPGDHATHDRLAAEAAPAGWYAVGTIPVSPRDPAMLDEPTAWRLRITYWPLAWRQATTLRAAPAVYAAAQIAGLSTTIDCTMVADHDGIQYRTPDGRPTVRQCYWEGREAIPQESLTAMAVVSEIDRGRKTGHMWGRPDTDRARDLADALTRDDAARRAAACETIAGWVRTTYPEILA